MKVSTSKLKTVVTHIFKEPKVCVIDWTSKEISESKGAATDGIYKFTGQALMPSGEVKPWSTILKILSPSVAGEVPPAHPLFWKREALMYQSPLLKTLPKGLTGPECYLIEEEAEQRICIWMKDIPEDGTWSIHEFAKAAKLLGTFNGPYAAGSPLPQETWLTANGSIRATLQHHNDLQGILHNTEIFGHPFMRDAFSENLRKGIIQLWNDSPALLEGLDRLPRVFCHLDAFRKNMRFQTQGGLTLLDWSYSGIAPIGTDPSDLAAASYSLFTTGNLPLPALFDVILDNYIEGLREAGWSGNPQQIQYAIYCSASLKYACLLTWLPHVTKPEQYSLWEKISGYPMEQFIWRQAELVKHLLSLAKEARKLHDYV